MRCGRKAAASTASTASIGTRRSARSMPKRGAAKPKPGSKTTPTARAKPGPKPKALATPAVVPAIKAKPGPKPKAAAAAPVESPKPAVAAKPAAVAKPVAATKAKPAPKPEPVSAPAKAVSKAKQAAESVVATVKRADQGHSQEITQSEAQNGPVPVEGDRRFRAGFDHRAGTSALPKRLPYRARPPVAELCLAVDDDLPARPREPPRCAPSEAGLRFDGHIRTLTSLFEDDARRRNAACGRRAPPAGRSSRWSTEHPRAFAMRRSGSDDAPVDPRRAMPPIGSAWARAPRCRRRRTRSMRRSWRGCGTSARPVRSASASLPLTRSAQHS